MNPYRAPLQDMQFTVVELAGLGGVARLPAYSDATAELVAAVLEEAGKFASDVLSPLNASGDREGAAWSEEGVRAAGGFADAYQRFVAAGWNGLGGDPDFGGQGLPALVATATVEMWHAANMSFALCPLLTAGAMEAIKAHASAQLRQRYLGKLVSGEWAGTMNLTESQAGSDLSTVRCKAIPENGHYRLSGSKIFITWGDHDMTENIVHLVLARLPDAPEGTRGISLFLVPKFLVKDDGSRGGRNDLRCASIEHKMGIHASPTCVMNFGPTTGAIGHLVGEKNQGLAHMFTMMNEARQKVGVQGLGIAERAYQQARDFAKERLQGRPVGQKGGDRVTIIHHPDVRRMLLTMKAQIEAMRALCYLAAAESDFAHADPDEGERRRHRARVDLLTPIVKGWCTEVAVEITSLGVQVHGGMGFVEETGAAQYYRDARIAPIYEGTTGIQAADLVGRKLAADRGAAMRSLIAEMRAVHGRIARGPRADFAASAAKFAAGIDALERSTAWMLQTYAGNPNLALAGSVDYLMAAGAVCGAWQMARAAEISAARLASAPAPPHGEDFFRAKIATAQYYLARILPQAQARCDALTSGAAAALDQPEDWF